MRDLGILTCSNTPTTANVGSYETWTYSHARIHRRQQTSGHTRLGHTHMLEYTDDSKRRVMRDLGILTCSNTPTTAKRRVMRHLGILTCSNTPTTAERRVMRHFGILTCSNTPTTAKRLVMRGLDILACSNTIHATPGHTRMPEHTNLYYSKSSSSIRNSPAWSYYCQRFALIY